MKTKMETGIIAILLLLAISCTKESTNSSPASAKQHAVSAQSSDNAEQSFNQDVDFKMDGHWLLYFDWSCTGSYSSVIVTVNADGTWNSNDGLSGLWVSGRRIFVRNFNDYPAIYSGIIYSKDKISGIMTDWLGYRGCFYMIPIDPGFKTTILPGASQTGIKK